MAYTLKFTHPNYPKNEEVDLYGVGLIKNGGTVKLDADAEQRVSDITGLSVKDYFKDNEMIEVTGTTELNKGGGED